MSVDKEWLKRATDIVGQDGVLSAASDLEAYGHDEYALDTYLQVPSAVVKPSTEEQTARIVHLFRPAGDPIAELLPFHVKTDPYEPRYPVAHFLPVLTEVFTQRHTCELKDFESPDDTIPVVFMNVIYTLVVDLFQP